MNSQSSPAQPVIERAHRWSPVWFIPALALIAVAWLAWDSWSQRGVELTVQLDDSFGLKAGDDVRWRGTPIGRVVSIELQREHLIAHVRLLREAEYLARVGSRFWVARPEVGWSRVSGLETIVGPRYMELRAGDGAPQRHYVALREPPVVDTDAQPGLEVILHADTLGSLRRGAPLTYREVTIGAVLSVGLASDASAVEARVHVRSEYALLLRENTRFWDSGGVDAQIGLTGVQVDIQSFESLVKGGVALAVPNEPGPVVLTGHRFQLYQQPREDWLTWRPAITIGSPYLPRGAMMPEPLRARMNWRQGLMFKSDKSRRGWLLQTEHGLLGPVDLLVPGEKSEDEIASLDVSGRTLPLDGSVTWRGNDIAILPAFVTSQQWRQRSIRRAQQREDCVIVADVNAEPVPVSAARLTANGDQWRIDAVVPLDEAWHGASVLAASDGRLIGMLLVDEEHVSIALLPETFNATSDD